MIRRRQKILHHGSSRTIVVPAGLVHGEEATLAANRLILVDPRGEMSEVELGTLLEDLIEPVLWARLAALKSAKSTDQ